ncbi:MAG TPA: thiamine pyrophosphate-dependent enzyme [Mucilaginibacter sp.]|jgi:pyruvate dehydrogenase (quinone)
MSKKVAAQLVEILIKAGVKRVYAVTGDSLNELNYAIKLSKKIKWIHVRHEEVAAYAAGAEAELTGFACCAGSSGPGHVHLIGGLYDAHRSNAPVLAIASTVPTTEFGTGYFQETSTIKLFDDCSHYNEIANTPAQLPRMAQAAIQNAIQRKGVSVLGFPGDLAAMPAVEGSTSTDVFFTEPIIRPSDQELEQLAALINRCPKVCIFCGIGAAKAHDEVVALAALLQAPVGFSLRGKMSIQPNNPYEVGMTGLLGLPSAYHSMHESDLVILLGTDFPYIPFLQTGNKIVQIDVKPENLGRRAKLTMGLHGNIKDTLKALLPKLQEKKDDSFLKAQLHVYEKVKEHLNIYVKDKGKENLLHPEAVIALIDQLATDSAIFTADTGMSCVWAARYLRATGQRDLLGSFNYGSMASAMPHAIGASFACPDRQVVALCGDGGISMLLGDIATIKQYDLPIKIVVFNNRALALVKLEMEIQGLPDNETDMVNPDFALIAEATGIKGISIRNPGELDTKFKEAFDFQGPVLIDVYTDPNALMIPPKITLPLVEGMALSMTRLMLGGNFQEVLDTVKSNYKHMKELLD